MHTFICAVNINANHFLCGSVTILGFKIMRQKLIQHLKRRIQTEIAPQSPLKILLSKEPEEYVDKLISITYLYTRPKKGENQSIYLVEIISAIGHGLNNSFKIKKDSSLAAKVGAFMLYTFEEMEILEMLLGSGGNGHATYILKVLNEDAIRNLWSTVTLKNSSKLPSETPYEPWTSTKHITGTTMIKTANREVLAKVTPETHPMVFSSINKSQEIGWQINKEVYAITQWALKNKTDAFSDIWEQQNPEAKKTKLRESKAIIEIATKLMDTIFYH